MNSNYFSKVLSRYQVSIGKIDKKYTHTKYELTLFTDYRSGNADEVTEEERHYIHTN